MSVSVKKELNTSTNLILVGMAVADCLNSVTIVFHGVSDIDAMLYVMFYAPVSCAEVKVNPHTPIYCA